MPESTSVSAAVEKMVTTKPAAPAAKEASAPEAPAVITPKAKVAGSEESSVKVEEESSDSRSAFEQELIDELEDDERKEFEAFSPEQQRQQMAWMKRQYRRQAKSMTELGSHRKVMAALREAGVTGEDLLNLTKAKRNGHGATTADEKSATAAERKRGYDRWREKAQTPEEREQLSEAEQVQRELVEDVVRKILSEEVGPIRQRLEREDQSARQTRSQQLESEINALEDEMGLPGSLVETHREAVHRLGLQEPKTPVIDLLVRVAGFQTVQAAMAKSVKAKEGVEKPPRSLSPVIKKPVQEEPARNSRGRASISKFVNGLLATKH